MTTESEAAAILGRKGGKIGGKAKVKKGFACPKVQEKAQQTRRDKRNTAENAPSKPHEAS